MRRPTGAEVRRPTAAGVGGGGTPAASPGGQAAGESDDDGADTEEEDGGEGADSFNVDDALGPSGSQRSSPTAAGRETAMLNGLPRMSQLGL